VEYIWERRHIYSVLVGKPEGKRPLGRHWRRWEENIKIRLKKKWYGEAWARIYLASDTDRRQVLLNSVMNPRIP